MRSDFPFTMAEVLPLLGIDIPYGKIKFYTKCPCCDDRKKHLNINLEVNAFRCPRCGFSGGILDLYAAFADVDRKRAFRMICERLHVDERQQEQRRKRQIEKPKADPGNILIDVDTRHLTYSKLLSMLSLASDHYENLVSRGLSEQAIAANQYRTTPMIGFASIARKLQEQGCYLEGVPGFYQNKQEQWCLWGEQRGILMPARDIDGRIQGLHIRLDNTENGKFRWLSSIDRKNGCGANSYVHIAGKPAKTVILTEGILKADIVHHLRGDTVISIQGVSSLGKLKPFLQHLQLLGTDTICTAYDMDYLTNKHVQKDLFRLYALLQDMGFRFKTLLWDPAYKGIDDWCLHQALPQ